MGKKETSNDLNLVLNTGQSKVAVDKGEERIEKAETESETGERTGYEKNERNTKRK